MNNTFKLIIAIVVSELAGIIGSVFTPTPKSLVWGFTTPSIAGWYAGIVKPALNPPAWVFGPVWTTLFVLMGIAAFLVWKKGLDRRDVDHVRDAIFGGREKYLGAVKELQLA